MKNHLIIKKVAVLGAGVMGAQIAAHLVNSNVEVILFDLASKEENKSSIVIEAIEKLSTLRPAPLADNNLAQEIIPANYDEDLALLQDCDLIIEAIAEKMVWKKDLYDKIEPFIKTDTILASNTSGLSINELSSVLDNRLKENFLGIHFFNPPRYMHLLEIIPTKLTNLDVVDTLEEFCVTTLGKGVVIAKDTPNFIANRVGVFSLLSTMHHAKRLNIPFEVVDQITGKSLGRPNSGTFRTLDIVGLDTMQHVINTFKTYLSDDSWSELYITPDYLQSIINNGNLGQKTRKGVYANKGKRVFNLEKNDYIDAIEKINKDVVVILKIKDMNEKMNALKKCSHPQAQFTRAILLDLFHYCICIVEDIANSARDIDFALRWGFGWNSGPFELMQSIGWKNAIEMINKEKKLNKLIGNIDLPAWVNKIENIHTKDGSYSPSNGIFLALSDHKIYDRQIAREDVLGSFTSSERESANTIFQNPSVHLWDGGDDIAILSFTSKMHSAGQEVLNGIIESCKIAEKSYKGLVIWQDSAPFCVGANLKDALELDKAGLESMVFDFQRASMALKHCHIPTVSAVQGYAFGGGCEIQMHTNLTVAAQESYIGLVESSVGLLPAGAGLKEFAIRASKSDDLMSSIKKSFKNAVLSKVSTSAVNAKKLGLLRPTDIIIANSHELFYVAKQQAIALSKSNFRPTSVNSKIKVSGKEGKAKLLIISKKMLEDNLISEYTYEISKKIASVLTGGEVNVGDMVTQESLLKLERKFFVELFNNEKSKDRVEHMLKTGKTLKN